MWELEEWQGDVGAGSDVRIMPVVVIDCSYSAHADLVNDMFIFFVLVFFCPLVFQAQCAQEANSAIQ